MKKIDRVIALLTASGKQIKIPKISVGLMEKWAAMPGQPYGNNRAEMFRHALFWMRNGVDRVDQETRERAEEAALVEAIRNDPNWTPPPTPEAIAEAMGPDAVAAFDECLSRALAMVAPHAPDRMDEYRFLIERLRAVRVARETTGKEAA